MGKVMIFAACALVIGLAAPLNAQTFSSPDPLGVVKTTPAEKAKMYEKFEQDYPLLSCMLPTGQARTKSPFKRVRVEDGTILSTGSAMAGPSRMLTAENLPDLWVNIAHEESWETPADYDYNFSKFKPSAPLSYTKIGSVANAFAGGVAQKDGILYCVLMDVTAMYYGGDMVLQLYKYNTSDFTQVGEPVDLSAHPELAAYETAQAKDGTVYGEFFTSDLYGLEYGIIDYDSQTRTTIGTASTVMVALGVTADNKLYGIGRDGNLYSIDTTTGAETLVGPTGVTGIANDYGQFYQQTGEIDPASNTFYWCEKDVDTQAEKLYTVDLTTGTATEIGQFSNTPLMHSMVVPMAEALDGAPARATNLAANFEGASADGVITFTAPTTTFNGEDLTGELSYSVKIGSTEYAGGTVEAGATATANVAGAPEGLDNFVVTTSNSVGQSPKATVTAYVGNDVPEAPANVELAISDNGHVTLTWAAPTSGVHNGYIGNLTYNVYRIDNDTTMVAEGIATTQFSETLAKGELKKYYYAVEAVNGNHTGAKALSNGSLLGDPFQAPYLETFDDKADFDLFTVVDNNNDNSTWNWYNDYTYGPLARYSYNTDNDGDDWLMTPPIRLNSGRDYIVSYRIAAGTASYPERIAVGYDTANTAAGMTGTLLEPTVISTSKMALYTDTISHPTDGNYYIGFHALSDANSYTLKVDSISVELVPLAIAPQAATGFSITPNSKGELNASVSLKAPSERIDGSELTYLSKVNLLRDGRLIHVFDSPEPGARLEYKDTVAEAGVYNYIAVGYIGSEAGEKAAASAFIGLDKPQAPKDPKAEDNTSSVKLSWAPASSKGVNGGPVVTGDLNTVVYSTEEHYGTTYIKDTLAVVKDANEATFDYNTVEGEQRLELWGIRNSNAAGHSSVTAIGLPVGTPDNLTWKESFPDGKPTHSMWIDREATDNVWGTTTGAVADADNGAVLYPMRKGDACSLNTYKISLYGAANPEIIFSTYNCPGKDADFDIIVQRSNGEEDTVYSHNYKSDAGNAAWEQHKVALAKYAVDEWDYFRFYAKAEETALVGLDKIIIADVYSNDLSVALTTDKKVKKGQGITVLATVSNIGDAEENNYNLKLYADGSLVADTTVDKPLGYFADKTFAFEVPTSSINKDKSVMAFKAVVSSSVDLDDTNNEAADSTILENSTLPKVEAVTLAENGNDIDVSWTAPQAQYLTVTDGFEDYDPFVAPFGEWSVIDGNPEGQAGQFWNGTTYPGQAEAIAFSIFNLNTVIEGAFDDNPAFQGHNGSQQFAFSPYEIDHATGLNYLNGDNYLVSPELSGEAQTVSFFARNYGNYPERFQVLGSTDGKGVANFNDTILADTTILSGEWVEVKADVPQGGKYFAIHDNSLATGTGNLMLSIDDVTFSKVAEKPTGYNVYRDGALIGHVEAGNALFLSEVSPGDGKEHTYSVTAVYSDGQESEPVEAAITVTGIETVNATGKLLDVYTLDGIRVRHNVRTAANLPQGVYIVNGNKVVVK